MLSLERLMQEAELRGLPSNKRRAIVREYAQTIILRALYTDRLGGKFFFMGGTALRFGFELRRFSQDLDFNARDLSMSEFKEIHKAVGVALEKEGFRCEILYRERGSILVSRIKILNILQEYNISPLKDEKLLIKIEVNQPTWNMRTAPLIINGFGYSFSTLFMNRGALLAEKIDALLNRCMGRDIYDVLFMLRRGFPFDEYILRFKGINQKPQQVLLNYVQRISKDRLKKIAGEVKPFLFDETEEDIILNAPAYFKSILKV